MDRLAILENRDGYRVGWWLADEHEFGLMLGPSESRSDNEAGIAVRAIQSAGLAGDGIDLGAWVWDTRAAANRALRVAREAIRAAASARELPEWAKTALAAGWKPPRGWKP